MKILVLNSGSSSIKYQLIEMPSSNVICTGLIERIGLEGAKFIFRKEGEKIESISEIPNHKIGLEKIASMLMDPKMGVIKSTSEIVAVGHRVVHGGSEFSETIVVNNEIKDKIRTLFPLAPLHNPANLEGIEVAEEIFKEAKQVVVFDTAFHQSIPVEAHKYAIPNKFLDVNHIRLYGFHGTSHKYVSEEAMRFLDKEKSKIITVHLGNGCSITAVQDGKSIDTSLGFGTMNGLIMGTRSGDIDQSLIFYLVNSLGYQLKEVETMLLKESGMLALTGFSDLREIEDEAAKGNKECQLALDMNAYRIKKYIGAYAAALNGLDALVFTAGIGENSDVIRKLVCTDMEYLGIELDEEKNNVRAKDLVVISKKTSKTKVLIIPTNEEVEIAKQTYKLVQ